MNNGGSMMAEANTMLMMVMTLQAPDKHSQAE